ncbi:MAG: hypothetical protein R3C03_16470 [Pirellulaceae bacterium]
MSESLKPAKKQTVKSLKTIRIRGVHTNNLKHIDLDIGHGEFVIVCGPSGSGKSSLAINTLFAEGQRRYVESFSPYARQYLDQIDKPPATELSGIPPSISVTGRVGKFGRRATLASTTELNHLFQLLFTKASQVVCPNCETLVERQSTESMTAILEQLPSGTKFQIGFPVSADQLGEMQQAGFVRGIFNNQTISLSDVEAIGHGAVIVDRLVAGKTEVNRIRESVATALEQGNGTALVWMQSSDYAIESYWSKTTIDDNIWHERKFHDRLKCGTCDRVFDEPQPQRLSDASPLGACPQCEGLGAVSDYDISRIVPDGSLSIREGAIAPWNSPAYEHEKNELIALAAKHDIDIDLPWDSLSEKTKQLIWNGVPEEKFGGLNGFFVGWKNVATRCTCEFLLRDGVVSAPARVVMEGG